MSVTAGSLWVIAGANIFRIGAMSWANDHGNRYLKIFLAGLVFAVFFVIIFGRLYRKHAERIRSKQDSNCPFSFFDVKGWLTMLFMIGMGVVLRKSELLPDSFVAVFYTGLSLALMGTGIRFIRYGWRGEFGDGRL